MTWMRTAVGVLSVVLMAGCATLQPEGPKELDPTGRYTLTTFIQGSMVSGGMRIRGEPGDYTGSLYTDFTGELELNSISVEGNQLLGTVSTPDGPADLRLTFDEDGESFTGSWTLGPESGSVSGSRVGG